jgi:7-carboxy-7-deazaguanine synthase (Cx14CxxC type)
MAYVVKEIFPTLQGEGLQSGRKAVFLRFSGCNLWSGREQDRVSATCTFCDTDFVDGTRYDDAATLSDAVEALWSGNGAKWVVITGGEPALQLDSALIDALHQKGFCIAIETNGTKSLPVGLDWVCVSPKADTALAVTQGDELKLVFPQTSAPPERFLSLAFSHFLLQPMDGPDLTRNTKLAAEYCLAHPQWRLSLQMHKLVGLP